MSESHAPSTHAHNPAPSALPGDSLWRQGAGVGTGVGVAVSMALAIGVGTSRFPAGGIDMLLAQITGVIVGVVIGSLVGALIGSQVTVSSPANH